jgi:hypothetical protein
MIIAAAVKIDGIARALPAPARHHNILHKFPTPDHEHGEQGFIDDQKGFVTRQQAARIAIKEGQIEKDPVHGWGHGLFSEDLW